jgi:DNA-binding MarR family transcriptional regulator
MPEGGAYKSALMKTMLTDKEFRMLAGFRLSFRKFQFFSEQASRTLGLTAQQYQALLAIKGHDDVQPFTVKELAQFLMIKHNSAVELVDRVAELGLVERKHTESDRRRVMLELTLHGRRVLRRLAQMHRRELQRIAPEFARYFRHFSRSPAGGD